MEKIVGDELEQYKKVDPIKVDNEVEKGNEERKEKERANSDVSDQSENVSKMKKRQMTLPLDNKINNCPTNDTAPTITTTAPEATSDNCAAMRNTFKTKRFYESEDDTAWMTQLFSQTIRSTSATPTDECEISDIVGIGDFCAPSTSTGKRAQNSVKPNDAGIHPMPNVSPTSQSASSVQHLEPFHHEDNHSNAEHSSADSQTDNIEMYNEPNLQSLIDNVADEHISINYLTDADILPLDSGAIKPAAPVRPTSLVSTPSIVLECYNDDLVKTDVFELERAHDHYSPPMSKLMQIPRRPLEGVCFFDTTIEEEEYYDADVESEGYNGNTYSKGTNTELPFDRANICPIKEAAAVRMSFSREAFYDCDESERTESLSTDAFECDLNELESDETFKTAQSGGDLDANEEDQTKGNNTHASQTSMQQHHAETESRTTITKKVTTSKKLMSTSSRTSSIASSAAFESINNSPELVTSENISTFATESSKSEKYAIKKKSEGTTGKKKSKKSKKSDSEKENISMKKIYLLAQPPVNWKPKEPKTRIITINRDVSVKHLCRSFGDLTDIEENKSLCDDSTLKRAKSVGDIRKPERLRPVQTGVSVRVLRDSYCNLVGLGSATNVAKSCHSSKKSSFSKFDALQKKNILRVRSSDAGKAQEKFNDANLELEKNCRACGKVVYKMEEIKAEKNTWHRNCFRCKECDKPLNVDTYQSHESVLYCKAHYKLLFAPKAVEDNEPLKPRKPELIIRENHPVELPPDVVRASDKPDLGLEELQQLNVKSRFQVFENYQEQTEQKLTSIDRSPSGVKRSASILSKLAKFQAKGMNTGVSDDALNDVPYEQTSSEDEDEDIPEGEDVDLVRAKRAQRERPMSFNNMNDIKTKFEKGHIMTKEERREECKQEIQNIRSRLFMGKQARIKEMYQQAVAESEQGITSTSKKPEIEIGDKAKTLKEKFEKGEIFNREEDGTDSTNNKVQEEEMAVFEQGISKKSRSIFMELDASAAKSPPTPCTPDTRKRSQVSPLQSDKLKPFIAENVNVVKCDEKADDIKIETSEISSKFKFFETYKPNEGARKEFRITPPRDGVVKMASPEREVYVDPEVVRADIKNEEPTVAEETHTTTKMLNVFRQMEQQKFHDQHDTGLKPLKRFTPPPDENRRVFTNETDEELSGSEDGEEEEEEMVEEEESEAENRPAQYDDEFLKQAQSAARAKQLRAKFEKWEANEIQREMSNGTINLYDHVESNDDGQIETAKSLRAKFELMKDTTNVSSRPQNKVNRFV